MTNSNEYILIYKHQASEELESVLLKIQTIIDLKIAQGDREGEAKLLQILSDLQGAKLYLEK